MKILLLGASSYVGARLYFDLHKKYDVTGTYDHTPLSKHFVQLDITKADDANRLITELVPDVIIHAANHASPRWCEAHPEEARALNETGTQLIVDAANKVGAKLIYISSFSAINPIDAYGKTKQTAEEVTKQTKQGWIVVRPSLIIGYSPNITNDRPFNRLLKNIDEGAKAEYDTSWRFQPTWLGHISEVINQVLEKGISGQTLPVVVDELKSRYDIARDILEPFGISVSPIDVGDTQPLLHESLDILTELGLPTYAYETVVKKIVQEIQEREKFVV